PDTHTARALRSKEESHDYRYFPDPDLPPLVLPDELIDSVRSELPELPAQLRARWVRELGLTEQAAQTLSSHPDYASFFNQGLALGAQAPKLANWVLTEVLRGATQRGLRAEFLVNPEQVVDLLWLVERGEISGKQAKELHAALEGTSDRAADVVQARGMRQMSDTSALAEVIALVMQRSPKQVEQYRAGKTAVLGYFVGQVMKETQGQANPKLVGELLEQALAGEA